MLPIVYAIVVLGCGHAVEDCTQLHKTNQHWRDREACESAVPAALEGQLDEHYPVLIARCEPGTLVAGRHVSLPERQG